MGCNKQTFHKEKDFGQQRKWAHGCLIDGYEEYNSICRVGGMNDSKGH